MNNLHETVLNRGASSARGYHSSTRC